jgi:hypothetical protein
MSPPVHPTIGDVYVPLAEVPSAEAIPVNTNDQLGSSSTSKLSESPEAEPFTISEPDEQGLPDTVNRPTKFAPS